MDYVGDYFELRPDTKNIKFSFTYGDEAVPQYITFTSTGRNEIRKITSVDLTEFGQDAAYKAEIVGDRSGLIKQQLKAVMGEKSSQADIMLPQNNVTLRAVYKTLRQIYISDLFLPVAGVSPRFDGSITISDVTEIQKILPK